MGRPSQRHRGDCPRGGPPSPREWAVLSTKSASQLLSSGLQAVRKEKTGPTGLLPPASPPDPSNLAAFLPSLPPTQDRAPADKSLLLVPLILSHRTLESWIFRAHSLLPAFSPVTWKSPESRSPMAHRTKSVSRSLFLSITTSPVTPKIEKSSPYSEIHPRPLSRAPIPPVTSDPSPPLFLIHILLHHVL